MLGNFLILQWKQARRSPVFQKSLVVNIILGLLILYFASIFLTLGFYTDKILLKVFPDQSPVDTLNGFLLFYFLFDLLLRFMLQDLPVMAVQPYLHLPINRSKLIHFMLMRSVPSVFNLLMLLFLFLSHYGPLYLPMAQVQAQYGWRHWCCSPSSIISC